jgi:hypothetical protein
MVITQESFKKSIELIVKRCMLKAVLLFKSANKSASLSA